MCRVYGFSATASTRLDCSLVTAQNALQIQSDRDRRGRRNADGWGLARWAETSPEIVRSTRPAFADPAFPQEAEATRSRVAPLTFGRRPSAMCSPRTYTPSTTGPGPWSTTAR